MSTLFEKISSVIKQAVEENDGEDKVTELNFSEKEYQIGSLTAEMKSAIQQCQNVDFLGLSDCGLNSLDNLPTLPKLETLDLKDNELDDEQIKKLKIFKHIKSLYLESNKITNIQTFEQLADNLTELQYLQVVNNPVSQIDGFPQKLWKVFPHLQVLNQHDKDGNEVIQAQQGQQDGQSQEQDYQAAEQSQDSAFSQQDYSSQNDKPKKQRKTK